MITNEDLRPRTLEEFIGQENLKSRLQPFIHQARQTRSPLPHILLTSPPGYGKTSLANAIANEVEDPFHVVDLAGMTERQANAYWRRWEGGVALVDEIQRLNRAQQENALVLLEEGVLTLSSGGTITVPWLTLIGATTQPERLDPALQSRFPLRMEFGRYTDEEMTSIIVGMAQKAGLSMPTQNAEGLARAACGVPRTARDLVVAYRALTYTDEGASVQGALRTVGLDEDGLDQLAVRYLEILNALDGQAGEKPISNLLGAHPSILRLTERVLVERGYMTLTPSGRVLTVAGIRRIRNA